MNGAIDPHRFCPWMVDNPIIPIELHEAEAQRQGSQVFTNSPGERRIRPESRTSVDCLFDAARCFSIVACDVAPEFKKIFYRLKSELLTAHACRF
jgi:hypothetical protein